MLLPVLAELITSRSVERRKKSPGLRSPFHICYFVQIHGCGSNADYTLALTQE
jgi:hypothetical protein